MTRTLALIAMLLLPGCGSATPTAPDPSPASGLDCTRFVPQASSPYVLPFTPGESSTVTRTWEHGAPQLYAVDFLRPLGSAVVAMRAGQVVEVEWQWSDTDHVFGHENHVFVEHADGTVARYFHLMQRGADVRVGDLVTQGQRIGRSGNSGNSTAPHLHVDVVERRCASPWPDGPYSDACHNTVPVTFRNTRSLTCGVVSGAAYTAFAP